MYTNNTICAIATAPGGAIGIIRISGEDAIAIADSVFKPIGSEVRLKDRKAYTLSFGNIVNGGEVIDEVLVSVFRAPHSYTGENAVEISCHGSAFILQSVMQVLIDNGCQPAGPGEFTQRAFLNGKMDLSQAEAVADLIASSNKATHDMALSQLKGHFSNRLAELRDKLLHMTSLLELELDFSDHEELEFADRSELQQLAQTIMTHITTLARSFEIGNALKHGIPVAIVGKTNVGKSTLLNCLLHEDKAIVSDVHGTTRDYIEDTTIIDGIDFRFVDTAGIRNTDDVVESIGIERTYQKLSEAHIILWIIDAMPNAEDMAGIKRRVEGKKLIVVVNKADNAETISAIDENAIASFFGNTHIVKISAKLGTNIERLEKMIVKVTDIPQLSESDIVVTSVRHYNALKSAKDNLQRVLDAMEMGLSGDLIAEDLRMVIDNLADITGKGRISSQETLNTIFSEFCIGK